MKKFHSFFPLVCFKKSTNKYFALRPIDLTVTTGWVKVQVRNCELNKVKTMPKVVELKQTKKKN